MATADDVHERLFSAAAELSDPAQRSAFLDAACAGNAALRAEIEDLLRHDAKAGSFLDNTSAAMTGCEPIAECPGTMIGPYKLMEQIGEGGFGLVFVAEQIEPVRRKVALKVIKPGMDTREVLSRFTAERQALALMDHPNIAKVFDGGATESGRPYFVMELVRGLPITEYCDLHQLATRERLELFVSVCRAVQHAHQKGIIHRDLKPSNILVTSHDGRPVVKVIDFGVAKAIGQQLTDRTVYTRFAQMVGTPLYMSPEQAEISGLDVDTRSDIYSLGVLLYELLTGTTPFDKTRLATAGLDEIRRVIREEEPEKPSTRLSHSRDSLPAVAALRKTEPAKLPRIVRGDLDWITMKCLEKDRGRRYETANGLAMDVQRYLADQPVLAGPPSATYRLRKLVRRNRGAVLATGLILLALVGGLLGLTRGLVAARTAARKERAALDTAEKRLAQIEKGNDILGSIFIDLDPIAEAKDARPLRAILADRLGRAVAALDAEAVGEPLAVARLQAILGRSLLGLGEARQAVPLLEQAADTHATMLGDDHDLTHAARHQLAMAYDAAGQPQRAVPLYQRLLSAASAKNGPDHPSTLAAMHHLAEALRGTGDYAQALTLGEKALALSRARLGPDHADTLAAMHNLAGVYKANGRPDQAVTLCEEALGRARYTHGPNHAVTLMSLRALAGAYRQNGEYRRAIPLFEEAIAAQTVTLGPDHPETMTSLNSLAATLRDSRQVDRALPIWERILIARETRLGADHPDTLATMHSLGLGYLDAGRLDQAATVMEQTLARMAAYDSDHPRRLDALNTLAGVRFTAGRVDLAIPLLEEILQRRTAKLGPDHMTVFDAMSNLAGVYAAAGRYSQALPLFEQAVAGMTTKLGPDHADTLWVKGKQARAYLGAGQPDKAMPLMHAFLASQKREFGADDPRWAGTAAKAAAELLQAGQAAEAVPLLCEALAIREKREPAVWTTFDTQALLGAAIAGQKRYAEAEPLLLAGWEGLQRLEASLPPAAKARMGAIGQELVKLYESTGKLDEATRWKAKTSPP
jgi:serine/threonine protein kinase/tetratricopeptide (TPR) repeat protein